MSIHKTLSFRIFLLASAITVATVIYISKLDKQPHKNTSQNSASQIEAVTDNLSISTRLLFLAIDRDLQLTTEKFLKSHENLQDIISDILNNNTYLSSIFVTNENGVVQTRAQKGRENYIIQTGALLDENHFNYQKHSHGQTINISIITGESPQNNSIIISKRIENNNGEFIGLVVAIMDSTELFHLVNSTQEIMGGDIYLLLNNSEILFATKNAQSPIMLQSLMNEANFKDVGTGKSISFSRKINDLQKVISFQTLHSIPITVAIITSENKIVAVKNNLQFISIIILLTMAIIAGFIIHRNNAKTEKYKQRSIIATQAKSDFLAKITYELKTPLNAIIGFSDMLSSGYFGKVNKTQIDRLKDINMCGNHLLNLICDIFELSNGESGRIILNEEELDIYNLTNQAIRSVVPKAKLKEVTILNNVSREAPAIYADTMKIKQIIGHLLTNSVNFTKNGGKIIISSHFDKERNFVITVSDTGVGIASQNIDKIMEMFEQIPGDNPREGAGLGLPLCKVLTEVHGGKFSLESKVNVGTKASITLPSTRIVKRVAVAVREFV